MRNRKDSRNQMRDFAAEISAALVQAREFVVLLSLGDVLTYGAVMA
jgi:precorrin-2 methylase